MTKLNTHEFHGVTYLPCSSADAKAAGYRWYRLSKHDSTGLNYSEEHSAKFRTLRDCEEDAIDYSRMRSLVAD